MSSRVVECHECGTLRLKSNMYKLELYRSPFDEKPYNAYVCITTPKTIRGKNRGSPLYYTESCLELLTNHSWSDFRFFECESCHRMICEQNPDNGWHQQYRIVDDEQICLRCYERVMYERGVSLESLESGTLTGMFFNNNELRCAGFKLMLENYKVASKKDAEYVCSKGIQWINAGKIVIVNYERMAIGGLEGYVSLWTKSKKMKIRRR